VHSTVDEGDGFREVKGKKTAKRAGIPVKKPQFEYRPFINRKKDVQESPLMGSVGRSASRSGKECFGALSSGFLNKTTMGNKKQTGGIPSSSSSKDKSVNVKNSCSVLSNIHEALSEEKVVESTKGKEKLNRNTEFNCVDSDSKVDEVLELDNGMTRFMMSRALGSPSSTSDVNGLSDILDY